MPRFEKFRSTNSAKATKQQKEYGLVRALGKILKKGRGKEYRGSSSKMGIKEPSVNYHNLAKVFKQ